MIKRTAVYFHIVLDRNRLTSFHFIRLYYRLVSNVAAFLAKYHKIQMAPNTDISTFTSKMLNLGEATVKGLEAELLLSPVKDLTLNVNYAYLNAKFTKIRAPACTVYDNDASGACAASGSPSNSFSPYTVGSDITNLFSFPYAPKHSVDVGADYTFLHLGNGSFTAHADYRWQSEYYNDVVYGSAVPGQQFGLQPSYGFVNGRLVYATDLSRGAHVSVSLWGKNLFDKRYLALRAALGNTNVATPDGFGGSTPAGFTDISGGLYSEPRSYGVSASYEF